MVITEKRCVVIAPADVECIEKVHMTFVRMLHGEKA